MYNPLQEQPLEGLSTNYSYKNRVFILDEITDLNTNRLIADITDIIDALKTSKEPKVIEWYINSPGGSATACKSLLSLMYMAKINFITNITYVLGEAGSSASLLAISGDYRYIYSYASHYIHYGSSGNRSFHPIEAKRNYEDDKRFYTWVYNMYIKNTMIPEDTLKTLMNHEGGFLYAPDALKYKLADFVVD